MSESLLETVTPSPATVVTTETQRKRWTWAYGLYTGVTSFSFTNAVWVIFLATHGYSPLAIGLMETLFHVAKFVAEVPTGAFADLVGRRASLIVACILNMLDLLLFLHPTPPLMILSFILAGTGFAFRGGAGDAILWSIAVGEDLTIRAASFSRLFSLMFVVTLVAELIGAATGGFMGHALAFAPFASQIAAYGLGICFLLQLPEQRGGTGEERMSPLRHIALGLRATQHTPLLLGLLILSALVDCIWTTTNYYTQLYVHVLGYSLSVVGVLVALTLATSTAFTALTPRLMRHLTGRWLVPGCFAALIAGLLLLSMPWPAASLMGYLLLYPASVAILTPALSTYINARSPEAQRATVLSFQTGMTSMAMIVLFPLFGLGVVSLPFAVVYRLMALVLGLVVALVGVMLWRRNR